MAHTDAQGLTLVFSEKPTKTDFEALMDASRRKQAEKPFSAVRDPKSISRPSSQAPDQQNAVMFPAKRTGCLREEVERSLKLRVESSSRSHQKNRQVKRHKCRAPMPQGVGVRGKSAKAPSKHPALWDQ